MSQDILVVDDEPDIRELVAGILKDEGYTCRVASTGEEALDQISIRQPNLLILDVWLGDPKYDGLKILEHIKKTNADLPIVMISGHGTVETAVTAIKLGAYDFIEKPFKTDRLLMIVSRAVEAAQLRRENRELRDGVSFPKMIGNSSAILSVRKTIEKVAPTNSRVLMLGDSGVGKELAAREIHKASKRASGPFLVLNCKADSEESLDKKLFGEEAIQNAPRKLGMLEYAHGGTLYLDEVTELSLDVQSKLVRFLHENSFKRSGGEQKVIADVRVFAGSQKDVKKQCEAGAFREDLFYRLNVITLQLPPLRERLEDLPELVAYFVETISRQAGVMARQFLDSTLAVMKTHTWPGNIYELRNTIERALILSPAANDVPVMPDELPPEIRGENLKVLTHQNSPNFLSMPLREAREYFEREYLLAQVQKFSGNISRTANFIGMERSALHRKLSQLQVERKKRA
ncbi:MAG: sigma-54-dependent Fis family transcriptional regulator [Alphaproteobacteria bacterium RIFCSPLOWO2_02_42_7]|nr:MAG: sigma-54-dependent Fis family transcriptional regulator [Alphaproteobacteria bacterium RIFCSPLOWO2_02_42_7]